VPTEHQPDLFELRPPEPPEPADVRQRRLARDRARRYRRRRGYRYAPEVVEDNIERGYGDRR